MIITDFILYSLFKHILGLETDKVAGEPEIYFCDSSLGCDRAGRELCRYKQVHLSLPVLSSLFLNCKDLIGPKIAIADDKIGLSKYSFFFP